MEIKIVRSARRTSTVSAREVDGYMLVHAPARMSDAELEPIISRLRERLRKRQAAQTLDQADLHALAQDLNNRYFAGALSWREIKWATNQSGRWGSCTPATRTIRISHRLATLPAFVRDYVVVHELAHLLQPNHGPRFWELVNRYPLSERARGYLMALGGEEQDEAM